MSSRLACLGIGAYRRQHMLARMTAKGFISPKAEIIGVDLRLGSEVFVGERVVIARWRGDGFVELCDGAQINRDCSLEVVQGGSITVGPETTMERGCVLISALEPIRLGRRVRIASYCAFHSYDHGIAPGEPIATQQLTSKGPIIIKDDVWLGVGVTILSGVTVGEGAVIGAGSVVTRSIPAGAIAVGVPARVVKRRDELGTIETPDHQLSVR